MANISDTLIVEGAISSELAVYPGNVAGGPPSSDIQQVCGLWVCTGIPANTTGSNGDVAFRSDGAVGATIYQKRAGAWVATAA